ncbi:MAG: redoxin domain-containing protein [Clostridia bacterium]|nr:redoxin domain-containing protein [Clostridia bacterium]
MKKLLCISLVLALTTLLFLVGCNNEENPPPTPSTFSYVVDIKTDTGKILQNVTVEFLDENGEFLDYKTTDENGRVAVENLEKEAKTALLSDVPKGYQYSESYTLGGTNTEILLTTQLINESHENVRYQLGDIMHDFTVTDQNGNTLTLSQILEDKEMVMLNFWYTTCSFCVKEFPDMNKVYDQHSQKAGFIGLNSVNNQVSINNFIANFDTVYNKYNNTEASPIDVPDLTLPLAIDNQGIENAFGFSSNPATVVIDRYGVISFIHEGALSESQLESLFAFFTSEDYTHTELSGVSQIPGSN